MKITFVMINNPVVVTLYTIILSISNTYIYNLIIKEEKEEEFFFKKTIRFNRSGVSRCSCTLYMRFLKELNFGLSLTLQI